MLKHPSKEVLLFGRRWEPCHTVSGTALSHFVADDLDPSLDELEEAFSVEAVTKDFFDQYREKYLDLKEFLDSNPELQEKPKSRGFDSEQFAKISLWVKSSFCTLFRKRLVGCKMHFHSKLTERERYKSGFLSFWTQTEGTYATSL